MIIFLNLFSATFIIASGHFKSPKGYQEIEKWSTCGEYRGVGKIISHLMLRGDENCTYHFVNYKWEHVEISKIVSSIKCNDGFMWFTANNKLHGPYCHEATRHRRSYLQPNYSPYNLVGQRYNGPSAMSFQNHRARPIQIDLAINLNMGSNNYQPSHQYQNPQNVISQYQKTNCNFHDFLSMARNFQVFETGKDAASVWRLLIESIDNFSLKYHYFYAYCNNDSNPISVNCNVSYGQPNLTVMIDMTKSVIAQLCHKCNSHGICQYWHNLFNNLVDIMSTETSTLSHVHLVTSPTTTTTINTVTSPTIDIANSPNEKTHMLETHIDFIMNLPFQPSLLDKNSAAYKAIAASLTKKFTGVLSGVANFDTIEISFHEYDQSATTRISYLALRNALKNNIKIKATLHLKYAALKLTPINTINAEIKNVVDIIIDNSDGILISKTIGSSVITTISDPTVPTTTKTITVTTTTTTTTTSTVTIKDELVCNTGYLQSDFSKCSEQENAFHEQNKLRAEHGVQALKMGDDDMCAAAQKHANIMAELNVMEHELGNSTYGQNLYYRTQFMPATNYDPPLLKRAMQGWYSEILFYNFETPKYTSEVGHFTQLVWRGSTSTCTAKAIATDRKTVYIATYYYPRGNILNRLKENVPAPVKRSDKNFDSLFG